MSASVAIEISKAVAEQLTTLSGSEYLGVSFKAVHSMLPRIEFESTKSVLVHTRPIRDVRQFVSRGHVQHDYTIEVAVRKHIDKDDSLVADEMFLLAERVADYWERDDSNSGQTRTLTGRNERLIGPVEMQVAEDRLNEHRLAMSVVLLTFRGLR